MKILRDSACEVSGCGRELSQAFSVVGVFCGKKTGILCEKQQASERKKLSDAAEKDVRREMEGNQLKPDDMEVDWGGMFRELLHRAPVILLIAVSAALLAALISRTLLEPVYLSSTKMYVMAERAER